jgi:NTP pyrophosphatase (non-canonical NTP hydrolase)
MSVLTSFQNYVGEWGNKIFNSKRGSGYNRTKHALSIVAHLEEEIEELKTAIKSKYTQAIAQETADCFLMLLHIAYLYSFDLLERAVEKMLINLKRTWGEPDEKGIIHHIGDKE